MVKSGNATIYVTDLDRAVKFYTELLGLQLQYQTPGWAQVSDGKSITLGLHPTHPGGPEPGKHGSISIGFELDEPLDQAYEALKGNGVKFAGPVNDTGFIRLAQFTDPDGNELYLSETKQRPGGH